MQILVIGGGGREHALAWKLAQSPRGRRVFVAPGNGGTTNNTPLSENDTPALLAFARGQGIDLVVIGPEAPLAAGAADTFRVAGLRRFGPSPAAAGLETSKAFAKDFMVRHGIPTARYATFVEPSAAAEHLRSIDYPVVIKASGLAAGKGVLIPESLGEAEEAIRTVMVERTFGAAGDEVVIEERLTGPEVSLLGFSDGHRYPSCRPRRITSAWRTGTAVPTPGVWGRLHPFPGWRLKR